MERAVADPLILPRAAHAHGGLRRLHSLSGVIPLGAFLVLHLWTATAILRSREAYDHQIAFVNGGAVRSFLAIVLVLVPLLFHAGYGVWLSRTSIRRQQVDHAYESDLLFALERVSGLVVLVFVVLHVWEFQGQTWTRGLEVASYSSKLIADMSTVTWGLPWIALGYLLGMGATIFHFVNGMTSFCKTWDVPRGDVGQRRARVVFRALGGLFFAASAAVVVQLATGARFFPAEEPGVNALCGSAAVRPEGPTPSAAQRPLPSSTTSATPRTLPSAGQRP